VSDVLALAGCCYLVTSTETPFSCCFVGPFDYVTDILSRLDPPAMGHHDSFSPPPFRRFIFKSTRQSILSAASLGTSTLPAHGITISI